MCKSDNSLFVPNNANGHIFNIIYVDDLVIGGAQLADINNIKMLLSGKFEMTDMKELHYFLGIDIIQTLDNNMISQ